MLFVIEDNMPGERFPLRIVHLTPHAGANLFLRTPVAADGTFQTQPFRSGNGHYLVHLPVHPALKKHGTLRHDIFRTELLRPTTEITPHGRMHHPGFRAARATGLLNTCEARYRLSNTPSR